MNREKDLLKFFASIGIKDVILLHPPEGASVKATITSEGDIEAIDKRTGKKRKAIPKE